MRILLCIFMLCFCVSISHTVVADYSHHSTYLVNKIKPNQKVGSKPTSSSYIKLASVQFLGIQNERSLEYTCLPEAGWYFDEVKKECLPADCSGYPYQYSGGSNPQLEMCALKGDERDVSRCLTTNTYYFKCNNCSGNLSKDGNGGCKCDREIYRIKASDGCPDNKDFINKDNPCIEISSAGVQTLYYEGCECPSDWEECTGSFVGVEPSCPTSGGKTKYKSCKCNYSYVRCDGIYEYHPEGAASCTEGSITKYSSCYTCLPSEGYIGDLNKYWCSHDWVDIRPISETYSPSH